MNISNIAKGFFKLAKGEELLEHQTNRLLTCMKCEHIKPPPLNICGICYCHLPAKVRIDNEKCPLGKW